MRKIFFNLLMFIATGVMAQQYVPNTHWPYVFENFEDGTIYFSNNTKSIGKMNIHLWGNILNYVNSDGKICEASDKDVVRVEIGGDAFLYGDHKLMQVIASKGNCVLLKMMKGDFDSMSAGTGAYGASLSTSAKQDLFSNNSVEYGKLMEEKRDGLEIPFTFQYYYVIGGKLVDASMRGIISVLDVNKKTQFESFFKTHKLKWKKEDSLKTVLDFFNK